MSQLEFARRYIAQEMATGKITQELLRRILGSETPYDQVVQASKTYVTFGQVEEFDLAAVQCFGAIARGSEWAEVMLSREILRNFDKLDDDACAAYRTLTVLGLLRAVAFLDEAEHEQAEPLADVVLARTVDMIVISEEVRLGFEPDVPGAELADAVSMFCKPPTKLRPGRFELISHQLVRMKQEVQRPGHDLTMHERVRWLTSRILHALADTVDLERRITASIALAQP